MKHSKYSERYFVNELVSYLRSFGAYVFIDQDTGHEREKSGWDFCYSVNGNTIFVEAKMENNQLSDYQKHTKDLILLSGGKYIELHFYKTLDGKNIKHSQIIIRERNQVRTRLEEIYNIVDITNEKTEELFHVAKFLLLQLGIKIK